MNCSRPNSSERVLATTRLLCLAVFATATLVMAQPPMGAGDGPPPAARERIETIVIGKFAMELELTTEQAERFYPRFNAYRHVTEDLQQQRRNQMNRLEELSRSGSDSHAVTDLLDAQEKQTQLLAEERRKFLSDVAQFLSPQQVSRCAILLDEVPRRIREFIDERRQSGPPPGVDDHRSRRRDRSR